MKKYSIALFIITLIALSVRLYNLTYHSLWFDEAISVHWARQSIPRILEVGFTLEEDRLPPLYYLLLKGWTTLVGFSETGLRSLSTFTGVLLIPVTASIASTLFNRRVALMTALLVALNPFLVWYSQETRMYAQAALFSMLTVWAFLQMCEYANKPFGISYKTEAAGVQTEFEHPLALRNLVSQRGNKPSSSLLPTPYFLLLISFILFALAGLYSHLYTGFILPALGLWAMVSYPCRRQIWLSLGLGGLVIGLLFAPLALAIWRFSGEATPGDPLAGLPQRAWWLLQAFTVWKAPLPVGLSIAIPAIFALFILAAYLKSRTTHHAPRLHHPLLLVSLLLLTPFFTANLLLLRNYLAFFGERYFIIMTPWLLLLAAVGADRISESANGRIAKFILHPSSFILLLVFALFPLPGQWSVPAAKEAWRQSVAYLAQRTAPNHAILIHPDWVRYPFQFYFRGPAQTYAAFGAVTPETALDGPLQGVVNGHPVVWLIQSHLEGPDPNRRVEGWLAARYPLVTELYPPGIILKGYAPGYQLDALPPEATPVRIQFKNGLQLLGYQADSVVSATDELFHPPSGWVHVTLYWSASQPVEEDVAPVVNLVGAEGVWGVSLERATDALKFYPSSQWRQVDNLPYPIIRHDVDVNLNPATPPGIYQLVVGLPNHNEQYPLTSVQVR
ncbi:MAG: glycosyltransferase family 39 protein [Anaerolineae bacterium]